MNEKTLISGLFPSFVATGEVDPDLAEGALHPEEEACVSRAVAKRRREFLAGRLCARKALAYLGVENHSLTAGEDRAPLWPEGIVGSITHTRGYCGAAVARKKEAGGIGLDAEEVARVKEEIFRLILREEEQDWIASLPEPERPKFGALLYSAKECLYKCQYPLTRTWLGFMDARILVRPDRGSFEAELLVALGTHVPRGARLEGRFLFHGPHVTTGMVLGPPGKVGSLQ